MGLPTPLTVEAGDMFAAALGAVRRGDRKEAEYELMQAIERVRKYDKARKAAIYTLNTGEERKTDD